MPWSTPVVSELGNAFVHAVRTAGRSGPAPPGALVNHTNPW
jgi:hypothetical protein